MKAFRLLAEAKTAAVGEWIKEALIGGDPTGGKVLIFAHHHSVHDKLAEALRKALDQPDQQLIHITGRTRPKRDVCSPSSRRSVAALRAPLADGVLAGAQPHRGEHVRLRRALRRPR